MTTDCLIKYGNFSFIVRLEIVSYNKMKNENYHTVGPEQF